MTLWVAFVDESYTSRGGAVLAAAVIDASQVNQVKTGLEQFRGPGGEPFHTRDAPARRRAEFVHAVGQLLPGSHTVVHYRSQRSGGVPRTSARQRSAGCCATSLPTASPRPPPTPAARHPAEEPRTA